MRQNGWCYHAILAALFSISGIMVSTWLTAAEQNPCSEDLAKFCKGVRQNQRAIMACLEEHEAQLSDACKAYEARMEKARAESREIATQRMRVGLACKDDIATFCNSAEPSSGGRGVSTCLVEHKDELSGPCKEAVKSIGESAGREKTRK